MEDVLVDGAQKYQTIKGFGRCLIAWSDSFHRLYRMEEFQKICIEGVGCNMLRVNMWGPTFEKPTEDWKHIRCEDFDMEANNGRPQVFVDFGPGILKLNTGVKIMGTVWSPPAWMKMSTYTPKTYTAMHYTKFVKAGAQRIALDRSRTIHSCDVEVGVASDFGIFLRLSPNYAQ